MRLQLFEWMDQPWLPPQFRDAMTRYLSATYRTTPFPAEWARLLAQVLRRVDDVRVVDIGSGSAGPVTLVAEELTRSGIPARVTLTDLYPPQSLRTLGPETSYWPEPVDARRIPASLDGVRTVFAAFHHFDPDDARAILRDAFEQRRAICVFEATSRTPVAILLSCLIPLLVLVMTPTIRPRSAFQLLFTYVLPVLPLLIFWDGLVSHLRTYSTGELLQLTVGFEAPDYGWTTGHIAVPGLPVQVPYLIGSPTTRPAAAAPAD